MDIKGFKNLLFTKAKNEGFSEYEIYYSEKKSFSVNIYKKQIEKYKIVKHPVLVLEVFTMEKWDTIIAKL
ncbi:MAG: hypothetical protein ACLUUN_02105 [Muribaculaceae bacterium]